MLRGSFISVPTASRTICVLACLTVRGKLVYFGNVAAERERKRAFSLTLSEVWPKVLKDTELDLLQLRLSCVLDWFCFFGHIPNFFK